MTSRSNHSPGRLLRRVTVVVCAVLVAGACSSTSAPIETASTAAPRPQESIASDPRAQPTPTVIDLSGNGARTAVRAGDLTVPIGLETANVAVSDDLTDSEESAGPVLMTLEFALPEDEPADPESSGEMTDAGSDVDESQPIGGAERSQSSSLIATALPAVTFVPVFDGPDGTEISLQYEFLDGTTSDYPLVSPTYFGGPLTLAVVSGELGDEWVEVQLPVRPTGSTAWIRSSDVELTESDWYVQVDVATNQVRAWQGGDLVIESVAVTGRPGRPTPLASTYIDDKVRGPNSAYGPWMLTLAAFSESINRFGGGIPKLALHGTDADHLMGQYASSGCIRLPNAVIEELAALVPVGTRVDIVSSR